MIYPNPQSNHSIVNLRNFYLTLFKRSCLLLLALSLSASYGYCDNDIDLDGVGASGATYVGRTAIFLTFELGDDAFLAISQGEEFCISLRKWCDMVEGDSHGTQFCMELTDFFSGDESEKDAGSESGSDDDMLCVFGVTKMPK